MDEERCQVVDDADAEAGHQKTERTEAEGPGQQLVGTVDDHAVAGTLVLQVTGEVLDVRGHPPGQPDVALDEELDEQELHVARQAVGGHTAEEHHAEERRNELRDRGDHDGPQDAHDRDGQSHDGEVVDVAIQPSEVAEPGVELVPEVQQDDARGETE